MKSNWWCEVTLLSKHKWFGMVSGLFVVMVLVYYLWPLLNYQEVFAGTGGDPLAHMADLRWFCDNFFEGEFHTKQYFYPNGVDLSKSYDMPILQTLACPLLRVSPVLGFNAIAMLQIGLIFLAAALVARKYLSNGWVRLAFVFLYGFGVVTLTRLELHQNNLSIVWTTALTFLLFESFAYRSFGRMVLSFLLLAVFYLSGWQNIANLTFLVVLLMGRHMWKMRSDMGRWGREVGLMLVAMVPGLLLFWYLAGPQIQSRSEAIYDFSYSARTHADVLSYVLPIRYSVWSNLVPEFLQRQHHFEQHISLDPLIVLLLLYFLLKKMRVFPSRFWLMLVGVYVVLSFGDMVTVASKEILPLPYYAVLKKLPPLIATRRTARLGVVVVFLVTLYVLRRLDRWLKEKDRPKWLVCVVPLVALYSVMITMPLTQNMQHRTFAYALMLPRKGLEYINKDNREVSVLNVPVDLVNDHAASFLQLYHNKPIMTGFVSYRALTPEVTRLVTEDKMISGLSCKKEARLEYPAIGEETEAEVMAFNTEMVQRLNDFDVRYVIVNTSLLGQRRCGELAEFVYNYMPIIPGLVMRDYTDQLLILEVPEVEVEDSGRVEKMD